MFKDSYVGGFIDWKILWQEINPPYPPTWGEEGGGGGEKLYSLLKYGFGHVHGNMWDFEFRIGTKI